MEDFAANRTGADSGQPPLVALEDIGKNFAAVQALADANLEVRSGEMLSIVGHNGAGKSTLMNILAGTLAPDRGAIRIDGRDVTAGYDVRSANALGIRCIFQELSLCPNLRVFENLRLMHPSVRGPGWRRRARRLIGAQLDAIFPGHPIDVDAVVGDLPIGLRQMVEIARAFTVTVTPLRLVILDEPTSSLDADVARQLLEYIGQVTRDGLACLFISHRLNEVLEHAHRTVVMRDGTTVWSAPTAALSRDELVERMGVEAHLTGEREIGPSERGVDQPLRVQERESGGELRFEVRAGEVVGLAGLAGHGQREVLQAIFGGGAQLEVHGSVAYVSGDRQTEGVFPLWSVGENITVGLLAQLSRLGLLSGRRQREVADQWRERINIRTPTIDNPILNLSGGNQQKVLVARAFATGADIVLLDDPLRGVDVGTKNELFGHIRRAAAGGRSFVWYTTENDELVNCDRIYVFYDGRITDTFSRAELTEERVLRASFAEAPAEAVDGD